MKDILVLFPSKTDGPSFSKVTEVLDNAKISYDLALASAHKDPIKASSFLKQKYKVIISGAGLSAALPGFIASQVHSPVIGVPCHGNYEGLDALLSIMQMPPGIPVLGVGVDKGDVAAQNAIKMLRSYAQINIVAQANTGVVEKAITILNHFNAPFKVSDSIDDDAINIEFVNFNESVETRDQLVIFCPVIDKNDDKAEAALNLLKHSTHGLWVGLNRADNAAIAAIEILNIHQDFNEKIENYRQNLRNK